MSNSLSSVNYAEQSSISVRFARLDIAPETWSRMIDCLVSLFAEEHRLAEFLDRHWGFGLYAIVDRSDLRTMICGIVDCFAKRERLFANFLDRVLSEYTERSLDLRRVLIELCQTEAVILSCQSAELLLLVANRSDAWSDRIRARFAGGAENCLLLLMMDVHQPRN